MRGTRERSERAEPMSRWTCALVLMIALLAVDGWPSGLASGDPRQSPHLRNLTGACYCRAQRELHCTPGLTQTDCDRRCAEAVCDEWFWLERLPCWNWGYGG
jgi:hypothetical protein